MLLVALTGGIGSGKSTVAELFGQRGAQVVDADAVARWVVEPGQPALARWPSGSGPGSSVPTAPWTGPALGRPRVRRRRQPARARGDHPPGDRGGDGPPDRRVPADAVVVVEIQLLVETWDQRVREYDAVVVGRGAAGRPARPAVARGMTPRRRGAAHGHAGVRRAAPRHRDVRDRQRRRPRRRWRSRSTRCGLSAPRPRNKCHTAPLRIRACRRSSSCPTCRPRATSRRRSKRSPRGSSGATASRRSSASPARASRSRRPR